MAVISFFPRTISLSAACIPPGLLQVSYGLMQSSFYFWGTVICQDKTVICFWPGVSGNPSFREKCRKFISGYWWKYRLFTVKKWFSRLKTILCWDIPAWKPVNGIMFLPAIFQGRWNGSSVLTRLYPGLCHITFRRGNLQDRQFRLFAEIMR